MSESPAQANTACIELLEALDPDRDPADRRTHMLAAIRAALVWSGQDDAVELAEDMLHEYEAGICAAGERGPPG